MCGQERANEPGKVGDSGQDPIKGRMQVWCVWLSGR